MNARPAARLLSVLSGAVILVACNSGGSTGQLSPAASASAKGWSTPGTLAVYDGLAANGSSHTVWVVGFNNAGSFNATAKVLAKVTLATRARIPFKEICFVPCAGSTDPLYMSTSKSHIYVLDGDATVRMLGPDGSLTKVTSIAGTATARAAFAVSPDDSQIAVGVIDFASQTSKLYVEKLAGGGRVDMLASAGPFYWPIRWRNGKIVLATGTNTGSLLNPYDASGYALIDPTAGAQPVALGKGDCVPSGTLGAAGTACTVRRGTQCLEDLIANAVSPYYYNSCLRRVDWSGHETVFLLPNNNDTSTLTVKYAALSPDGQAIMTDQLGRVLAPVSDTHGGNEFLGSSTTRVASDVGMGWISDELFSMTIVNSDGTSTQSIVALNPPDYSAIRNVPFEGAAPVVGRLVGTLPGGL